MSEKEKDFLTSLEKLKLRDEALLELEEREKLKSKPPEEKRPLLSHLKG